MIQTISQVSKTFQVSTRTLRYYEQIGLLRSSKQDGYAYRTYDGFALQRLRQILVLRRLQIPLKAIKQILVEEKAVQALEIFEQKVQELNQEITSLAAIRAVLQELIAYLDKHITNSLCLSLLEDESIVKLMDSLSNTEQKEEYIMSELENVKEEAKLKDVRIVYLPPAAVASSHFIGKDPEQHAGELLDRFVSEHDLPKRKPDLRFFGFNHPNPSPQSAEYGYESWVTIPDDMEVPLPLTKKYMAGGLYAAHMITMGNFHEWEWLGNWVEKNEQYTANLVMDGGECMHGLLEEHLFLTLKHVQKQDAGIDTMQLDLLFPIKLKD